MIALRSTDGDRSFQVYDDGELIGHIRMQIGLTGEKYLASVDKDGEEKSAGIEFNSPNDAIKWIEKQVTG
jgi:hypothetical protein